LGKFWKALEGKMLEYCMAMWNILRPFGIINDRSVQFAVVWYIFFVLVCLDLEKSGNPGHNSGIKQKRRSFFGPLSLFFRGVPAARWQQRAATATTCLPICLEKV
jgi:hypothetical protein